MASPKTIAISVGDPNGIGPEVTFKAICQGRWPAGTRFVLIGHVGHLAKEAARQGLTPPPAWKETSKRRIQVYDPGAELPTRPQAGKIDPRAGRASYEWVRTGIQWCLKGQADALVTAPICKASWNADGINYPGHTELLARDTRTREFAMLLMGGDLRVLTVTRHLPLADVATSLKTRDILSALRLMNKALPWLGYKKKRIGVCALNPHAGENGTIGKEEIQIIKPAIQKALKEGIKAIGPIPSDVIFHYALKGDYDGILSMYHDQGLGPLKMLGFDQGVNITLGLPIVRVSPDHGTAFDIAGKNKANPSSMTEALRWAVKLAGKRNPWAR